MKQAKWIRVFTVGLLAWMGATVTFGENFQRVDFSQLAAKEYMPSEPAKGKKKVVRNKREYLEKYVTPEVMALDGKSVEIAGYMMALSLEGEKVNELILLPDTGSCCYGTMPAHNGFVFARVKKGVNLFDNVPIRIRGKLTVEEVWESGFFSYLYYVEVEEVALGFGETNSKLPFNP